MRSTNALLTLSTMLLLLASQAAHAQMWDETLDGGGDAFDLLPGQIARGSGPLLRITGDINNPDFDVDLYCIYIDDPANFSASVTANSSLEVSQLWLIDQGGFGVAHAVDRFASGGFATSLNGPFQVFTPPGNYFLGISRVDLDPLDATRNPLFSPNNPTSQIAPDPFAGPLVSWNIPFGSGIAGPYTIDLVGASYHVPEPTSFALLGLGLVGIAVTKRRNLRTASGTKTLALSACLALALTTIGNQAEAAIMNVPGLTTVRFWESTGPFTNYDFSSNSLEMTSQLGVGVLGPVANDFSSLPDENYDVFYSDANGKFNINGNYVTVEAVWPHPRSAGGGGLNLGAVDLIIGSNPPLRADVLASFVALGDNYIPGSEQFAVDAEVGTPTTDTTMGNTGLVPTQHMRVTVTWSNLVPEPSSVCLGLVAVFLQGVATIRGRRS